MPHLKVYKFECPVSYFLILVCHYNGHVVSRDICYNIYVMKYKNHIYLWNKVFWWLEYGLVKCLFK
jgi:hypothetical protein